MKKIAFVSICLTILFACNPDKNREVDINEPNFQTTDQSELFFKNVRLLSYDKSTFEAAKLDQFRFKDRNKQQDQPILNLCIVQNWRADEAYVLVEPNDFLENEEEIIVLWKDLESAENGSYSFSLGPKEIHYKFATQLYTSIQKNHELSIKVGGEEIPLMKESKEREAIRIPMVDFYRLVGVYK